MKSDADPAGTAFAKLALRSTKQTKTSIKLTWNKVKGAKRYIVYGNACGKKNKLAKLATTGKTTFTTKKANGKKLKKGTYYKLAVIAIDKNGAVVSSSKIVHVATLGGKVGNPSRVAFSKPKKGVLKLKRGKTFTVKAKIKAKRPSGAKVRNHRKLSFESSNPKVASVSKSGKVKARAKGTCYVFAYAQNGVFAKLKVRVR